MKQEPNNIIINYMENKHTQYVDFSNPNADKITTGVTNKPMINKKQTAVEWLVDQLSSSKYIYNLMEEIECQSTIVQPNIFNQAKEMEKQQIEDAWIAGMKSNQNNFQGI
jgi:hypothetical protein